MVVRPQVWWSGQQIEGVRCVQVWLDWLSDIFQPDYYWAIRLLLISSGIIYVESANYTDYILQDILRFALWTRLLSLSKHVQIRIFLFFFVFVFVRSGFADYAIQQADLPNKLGTQRVT
jgi:hypothetical protein